MSLLAEVQAQAAKVNVCRVAKIREELPEGDREDFDRLVMDQAFAYSWIIKALRGRGLHLSDKPLGRHRAKECTCFREF